MSPIRRVGKVHAPLRSQPQTLAPNLTMMASMPTDRRNVIWFIAWMLTGAGYALGILGALSIGPYILVITVAATIVLATHTGSRVGLPGVISGLSLPLFYVAFLNRSGPGMVCTSTATSRSCVDEWSPCRGSRSGSCCW